MITQIQTVVRLLKQGGVVALPTETVYALACDVQKLEAVARIFRIKKRNHDHPLSVLIPNTDALNYWTKSLPDVGQRLIQNFWPGPLTLVLQRAESSAACLLGMSESIALRLPDHAITRAILDYFPLGLAAPSANRTHQLSPTTANHVCDYLGAEIDYIIDAGSCSLGIESTLVDVCTYPPRLLREAALTKMQIRSCVSEVEMTAQTMSKASAIQSIQPNDLETQLTQLLSHLEKNSCIAILARRPVLIVHPQLFWITMPESVRDYAQQLYEKLHVCLQKKISAIFIEALPEEAQWSGVRATLQRILSL